MNNLHEQLENTTLKPLTAVELHHVWERISQRKTTPSLFIIFFSKHMTALVLALVLVLGGGGIVAASNNATPGDALYKIDLAAERARLALAGDTKKQALAVAFANERLVEIQKLRGDGSIDDSNSATSENVTEIEADIFTNETVVKLEINDQKYGFTTDARTREAIVAQIAEKYKLDKDFVDARISVEVEDRASRAQDKDFIVGSVPVVLTEKQKRDIDTSFAQSIAELGDDNAELVAALAALMQSTDDGKLKFEQNGQEIEIESEDGVITIEVDNDDSDDDHRGDDNDRDGDSRSGSDDRDDSSSDDTANDGDDSDDDRDNSGRGSDDDKDHDKDDDKDDSSKHGGKDDDSKDDDSDRR